MASRPRFFREGNAPCWTARSGGEQPPSTCDPSTALGRRFAASGELRRTFPGATFYAVSAAFFLLGVSLLGCGPGSESPSEHVTVSDSAGVAVWEATSPDDVWAVSHRVCATEEWEFPQGSPDAEGTEFFRIVSGFRRANGEVVVADGGNRLVLVLAGPGRELLRFGREGEGPGEFQDLSRVFPVGSDGVAGYDARLSRVQIFDGGGQLKRTVSAVTEQLGDGGALLVPVGVVGDESLVAHSSFGFPTEGGAFVPEVDLVLLDATEEVRHRWSVRLDERVAQVRERGMAFHEPLFSRSAFLHARDDRILIGHGSDDDLRVLDSEGQLQAVVRLPSREEGLPDREIRELLHRKHGAAIPDQERRSRVVDSERELMAHDAPPSTAQAFVAADGRLAVRLWTPPSSREHRWLLIDPESERAVGWAPDASHRLLDVGEDWVLEAAVDSLDVESVRLMTITTCPEE